MWIIILAALALSYFYGWGVLLFLLLTAIVIALGTYAYDRFWPLHTPGLVHWNYWFQTELELAEIGELLSAPLKSRPFDYDFESYWEWITANSLDNSYEFNISRKRYSKNRPALLKVAARGDNVELPDNEVLGRLLASLLKTGVKTGTVEYISGNDYQLIEAQYFPFTES